MAVKLSRPDGRLIGGRALIGCGKAATLAAGLVIVADAVRGEGGLCGRESATGTRYGEHDT